MSKFLPEDYQLENIPWSITPERLQAHPPPPQTNLSLEDYHLENSKPATLRPDKSATGRLPPR